MPTCGLVGDNILHWGKTWELLLSSFTWTNESFLVLGIIVVMMASITCYLGNTSECCSYLFYSGVALVTNRLYIPCTLVSGYVRCTAMCKLPTYPSPIPGGICMAIAACASFGLSGAPCTYFISPSNTIAPHAWKLWCVRRLIASYLTKPQLPCHNKGFLHSDWC